MDNIKSSVLGASQPILPPHTLGEAFAPLLTDAPFLVEMIDRRIRGMFPQLQAEQQAAVEATQQNEKLVDKHVAAAECHVAPQTIWTWHRRGDLPGTMVGNRILFRLGDIRALLKNQTLPNGRRKYARRTTAQKSR